MTGPTEMREQLATALRTAYGITLRTQFRPIQGIGSASIPEYDEHLQGSMVAFLDAVMLIVGQILAQRDRARAAGGRAYQLADRWEAAHGSAAFLVRAAGVELREALDDSEAAPCGLVYSDVNAQVDGLSGVDEVRAAECSAQHHGFDDGPRQCIRAAQHRGDHIDQHGFHWSDTVAIYPVIDGEAKCGRAAASSCSDPDHACQICGDCMYEHPGEEGCPGKPGHPAHIELATAQAVIADLRTENRALRAKADRLEPALIEQDRLTDELKREQASSRGLARKIHEQRVVLKDFHSQAHLGFTCFQENHAWQLDELRLTATGEKERADQAERQRNDLAQALREVLAAFHEVKDDRTGNVVVHDASYAIHPSNFNRWRAALKGLPANCATPGGCCDCPHEMEA